MSGPSDLFWLDDLNCNGSENHLALCPHSGVGVENCGSGEHVKLRCRGIGDNRLDGKIRFSKNNILEINFDNEWRGVCDDNFSANAGKVACKQLGGEFISFKTGVQGPSDIFWLDDLLCVGNETSIDQCSHATVGEENCGTDEHVQLFCVF